MESYEIRRTSDGRPSIEVPYRGERLLNSAIYNKGSAFSLEERVLFGLEGLLPEVVSSIERQAERVYENLSRKRDPLEKYIGLCALQDRNENLYYRVLIDHLEELLPIVYTPTVGQASVEYSHIFRRGRGIWITPIHRGRVESVLRNSPYRDVRLIVATDNSAILGLGDQGAGGMVIPVGKLAIYSAAAGIHPTRTLPVSIDVGTENEALLGDPFYMGWREHRLRGEDYASLIEEFVAAVRRVFPRALIQWEDFSKENAFDVLERYRRRLPSFNDDIQGTGSTALAGFLAAAQLSGKPFAEQVVVIAGGGAAGKGIAVQLAAELRAQGVAAEEVVERIALLDSRGLITTGREGLEEYKRDVAWPEELARARGLEPDAGLAEVVERLGATALVGVSGCPGLFSEQVVKALARRSDRPIVLPFSNPTDKTEATPAELLEWTDGRALIATGSPFPPVSYGGRTIEVGQGNNALAFPGVGLGALVARASEITDGMFAAAAHALAAALADDELAAERLYPSIARLRAVTRRVAAAVAAQARDEGVGRAIPDDALDDAVAAAMWAPGYPELVPCAARRPR